MDQTQCQCLSMSYTQFACLHSTDSTSSTVLALKNRRTWAHRYSFPPSPPAHPIHHPPSAFCLFFLGDDNEDDEWRQHNSCNQEAAPKNQHGFVLEHPRAHQARFVRPAGLHCVIFWETTVSDNFSVDSDGGLGFGLVLGWSEKPKLRDVSILQFPHVETLQVNPI